MKEEQGNVLRRERGDSEEGGKEKQRRRRQAPLSLLISARKLAERVLMGPAVAMAGREVPLR